MFDDEIDEIGTTKNQMCKNLLILAIFRLIFRKLKKNARGFRTNCVDCNYATFVFLNLIHTLDI